MESQDARAKRIPRSRCRTSGPFRFSSKRRAAASRSCCSGLIDRAYLEANRPGTQIKIARLAVGHLQSPVRPVLLPYSLHSRIETVSPIEHELEQKAAPRRVILEIVVKLRRHCAQLRQIV